MLSDLSLVDENNIITFVAQYEKEPEPEEEDEYVVSFFSAKGAFMGAATGKEGTKINLPQPEREGYDFAGWQDKKTGEIIKRDAYEIPDCNVDLVATWTPRVHKITFYTAKGTIAAGPEERKVGENIDAPPKDAVDAVERGRLGYSIIAWIDDRGDLIDANNWSYTMPDRDVGIWPVWEPNEYTLTFDAAGGKMADGSAITEIKDIFGAAVDVPKDPTRADYVFGGWDPEIPEHMPAENTTIKATWHKHVAGEPKEENIVKPTCEENGSYEHVVYCSECGEEMSRDKKTTKALGHVWNEWNITKTATCCEEGVEERICERDSSHEERRIIAIEGSAHDWDNWTLTKKATCSEPGTEARICKLDSSHTETRETSVDNEAHDFGAWKKVKDSTCAENGLEERVCSHDGKHIETRPVEINPDAHDWEEGKVTKEATCNGEGIMTYECKHDSTHKKTVVIKPIGHDWRSWTQTKPATEDEDGEETRICAHDETHVQTRAIPKHDHVHVEGDVEIEDEKEPTCLEEGSYDEVIYCIVCGRELSRENKTLDPIGHDWDEGVATKKPTCTDSGTKTYTCKHDGTHTKTEAIDSLGHDWGEWVTKNDSTGFYKERICNRCGEKQRIEIECQHDDLTEIKAIPASCTEAGYKAYHKCNQCGNYIVEIDGEKQVVKPNNLDEYIELMYGDDPD